jgi:protein-L-isoaspartate(D-aspartate) O-methyltransferase
LAGVPQVEVRIASAVTEDSPAADVVYVCAGVTHPPREWLRALKIGGRMVFPLTGIEGSGVMMVVTREAAQGFAARSICGAAFIACADATSPEEARAVSEALARSRAKSVRSLVLDAMPDATAWLAGDGWFFSTADQATRKVPFANPS